MASDLSKEFEQEQDLSQSFASEQDLAPVQQAPAPDVSWLESALRGGVQGATLGFSDEAMGALGAAGSLGEVVQADDSIGKLKELYQRYRDIERGKNKAAEDANPKTYLAGNVAGGIGSSFVPGLGATTLGKTMALGAAGGLGVSEAESISGDMGNAALGSALGAVGHGVGKMLGKVLSPEALKQEAKESAAFAVGAKGLPSNKQKIGESLLSSKALNETGVSEEGLGAIRKAASEAEQKLQPMLERAAQKLQGINPDDVSAAVGGDAGDKVQGLLHNVVDRIKDMSSDAQQDFYETIAPKVQDYILKLKEAGNNPARLNEIKRAAQQEAQDIWNEVIKYKKSQVPTPKNFEEWAKMADDIRDVIKGHIEQLGDFAEPGLGQAIKANNYHAGGLAGATKALNSKLVKGNQGIKTSNPIEYAYHPKWALLKDAVKNLGSEDLALAKAKGLSKTASALETGAGKVGADPEMLSKRVEALSKKTLTSPSVQETAQGVFSPRKDYQMSPFASPKIDPSNFEASKGNKTPVEFSNELYSKSEDELKQIAESLSTDENFKTEAAALNRALANKDIQAKNASLFLILSKKDKLK